MPPTRTRRPVSTGTDPGGDHRTRLVHLRDELTDRLNDCPVAYVAGIARQLQSVLDELATLPDPDVKPSPLDELQARSAARRAGAPDSSA